MACDRPAGPQARARLHGRRQRGRPTGAGRICDHQRMWGCLVAALLIVLLFVLVPIPLWPFLIVGLVVLFVIAAALGLLKGFFGLFTRR
jgi:hypothetical protein